MASLPIQKKEEATVPGMKERSPQEPTSTTDADAGEKTKEEQENLVPASLLAESQLECKGLRDKVAQLQRDLHDAQDFVFSLQPRQQAFTEAEAVEEFQSLCAAVEEWVDQKLGDSLEEMNIAERLRVKDVQNLLDLIPQLGKHAFSIPRTDVDNIQAMILRYLCDCIFSQDFYCPFPKEEREFLTMIERSMRALQPRRDIRTCRQWRIETYTALSERPGFRQYSTTRMLDLTFDLVRMLRALAPDTDPQKLADSFFETVMKPASELARKMHLSLDEFSLEWSPYHDRQPDPRAFEDRFADCEFVDVNSRKTIKERPQGDVDVRWMFDLTPKLVFRKLRADSWAEGKTLIRPRILVSVTAEKRMEDRPSTDSTPTALGKLERGLQNYYAQMRQDQKPQRKIFGYPLA